MTLIAKASRKAGVDRRLIDCMTHAADTCPFDIMLLEGVRSVMRQSELLAAGASQTMDSAHITGEAIDLGPVIAGEARWDWPLFYVLAEHMQKAARILGTAIRWGGCWDTELSAGPQPEAIASGYASRRKAMGKKAFLDGPHFELWIRRPR